MRGVIPCKRSWLPLIAHCYDSMFKAEPCLCAASMLQCPESGLLSAGGHALRQQALAQAAWQRRGVGFA